MILVQFLSQQRAKRAKEAPSCFDLKLFSKKAVKGSCCMMRPKVPPMAVMIKMGAAVCMPFSTTSFKETELFLSKRKASNMPIPRAKLGEQSRRKKGK